MPGDPLALLADQKRDDIRNVVRLSKSTQSGHLCSHLSPLGILRQHVGLREAGGHGVDCDAAPSQFLGERPGELLARCLAPHVHSEARKAHRRGARRDIDDPTPVPPTTCGFLKSKKGSLRVQSERRVELVLRDFGYGVRLKPPALFTRISRRPNWSRASWNRRRTSQILLMSLRTARARP